jgi:ketosteroid isomerase-like protein
MKRFTIVLLCLFFGVAFFACHQKTEEDAVRGVVREIQAAAEQKDVKNFIRHLSESYLDPQGNNREMIKALLMGYFFRYPKISVYLSNLQIKIEGTRADVSFEAVLTSGEKTGSLKDILPQALGIYAFDVIMKKESRDWKVVFARWEDIGSSGDSSGVKP